MRSVNEARIQLLAALPVLPTETVLLAKAARRVLARPLQAPFDLPLFNNSSMDGFALRAVDIAGASEETPRRLRVVADIPAGSSPVIRLDVGQAARIMTGAPLPDGADTVVPVELTDFSDRSAGTTPPEYVEVRVAAEAGAYVRRRGEDLRSGAEILAAGIRLRPQDVGMAAMLGAGAVEVFRAPRVAVLSTGDELLTPGAPPEPGKIYESNSPTIAALVEEMGGEALQLGIAADNAVSVQEKLDAAVEAGVDLIVSSAGVSVGAYDFVKGVVEAYGSLDFWRVNMRPGKPLAFGTYRGLPYVGLPGNPVSSFVGFEVFLRPALAKMSGWSAWTRDAQPARLAENVTSDGRESYLRALVSWKDGQWIAQLTGHQGSGNHFSLVQANAFVIIPAGVHSLEAGAEVIIWKFT